ncbi:MAG: uracil-DNA glycosylase [Terriglobia bacterium]
MPDAVRQLAQLQRQVIACTRCANLIAYCRRVAKEKRRMYRDCDYWGKPVPGFGDPRAELLILGLAPGAHGSNRTGRMFTGDRSGDFLYRALHEAGFANQPTSRDRSDGLELRNCYITAALRCAPPENKPHPEELRNCQPYLERELEILRRVRAVLVLGRIAFDSCLRLLAKHEGFSRRSALVFSHGASFILPAVFSAGASLKSFPGLPRLFCSYHPSQQNTQTGRLTPEMFQQVLRDIRDFLGT